MQPAAQGLFDDRPFEGALKVKPRIVDRIVRQQIIYFPPEKAAYRTVDDRRRGGVSPSGVHAGFVRRVIVAVHDQNAHVQMVVRNDVRNLGRDGPDR